MLISDSLRPLAAPPTAGASRQTAATERATRIRTAPVYLRVLPGQGRSGATPKLPPRPLPAAKRAAPERASACSAGAPRRPSLTSACGDVEAPLLVGRVAIGAQAGLRESGELLGQRPGLGQRLAFAAPAGWPGPSRRPRARRPRGRSGSCRGRGCGRSGAAGAPCRRRSAARPSAGRTRRTWRSRTPRACRTTAPARGRRPRRSPRRRRSPAWSGDGASGPSGPARRDRAAAAARGRPPP